MDKPVVYTDVKSYKYTHCYPELKIQPSNHTGLCVKNKPIYFIFDCPGEDAFAHWIFETFMFNNLIIELNKLHKNITIVCSIKKQYVTSFLKFFNITNAHIQQLDTECNIVYVPPVVSLNYLPPNIMPYFTEQILMFREGCRSRLEFPCEKTIDLCYFPRQKIENYAPNDIKIDYEYLITHVKNRGGLVIDTFETNNISTQFTTLLKSKTIILTAGSAYLVNGVVAHNSLIIVLGGNQGLQGQIQKYPAFQKIHDVICSQNRVEFIGISIDQVESVLTKYNA
jgi:hypothetical protein